MDETPQVESSPLHVFSSYLIFHNYALLCFFRFQPQVHQDPTS